MTAHIHSSCPIARRSHETFVEWSTIGGERRRFEFNREVLWLQESESQIRFVHGGQVLKECSTYNDYYGYLTSADSLDKEAVREAQAYGITRQSTLVLEVVARVFQTPVIETEEAALHNRTKPAKAKSQWAHVPDDWRKEVFEDGQKIWPSLARVSMGEEVVWSSKLSEEASAALLQGFKDRWRTVDAENAELAPA